MALVDGPTVFATSVIAPDYETMVQQADLIFTGRMVSQHGEWREFAGKRSIVTIVKFEVLGVQKGHPGGSVELQFLGGTVGDTTLDVTAMPKFKKAERTVLFVQGNGVNASPVVGFYHGKFRVESDGQGQDFMTHPDGTPLTDISEIGKAHSRRAGTRALSLSEFTSKVSETAKKRK
jgi:hypothetical protein